MTSCASEIATLEPITEPYLLCLNVRSYRDAEGHRYFDELWLKDLERHTRYLKRLILACPCNTGDRPPSTSRWDPPPGAIRFIDLPSPETMTAAILHLPMCALRIWREIGESKIVHLGVAGWPIPFGWIAWPMAIVRKKPYVVVVESAPWRLRPGIRATLGARVRERVSEALSRWCVNHADLVVCTQQEYCRSLLTRAPERGHVIQASWLDQDIVLTPAEAAASWQSKSELRGSTLKLLFAGRLEQAKGVTVLLEALRMLEQGNPVIELDFVGEGDLRVECERASKASGGRMRTLDVVPYGPAFFRVVRQYDAVVVPSLSDEQPRIVYDAYSQAVPVLATDTPGLRECVQDGVTGVIVSRPEAREWAVVLRRFATNRSELQRMGLAALEAARPMTHAAMHERRWRLLREVLDGAETVKRLPEIPDGPDS